MRLVSACFREKSRTRGDFPRLKYAILRAIRDQFRELFRKIRLFGVKIAGFTRKRARNRNAWVGRRSAEKRKNDNSVKIGGTRLADWEVGRDDNG